MTFPSCVSVARRFDHPAVRRVLVDALFVTGIEGASFLDPGRDVVAVVTRPETSTAS